MILTQSPIFVLALLTLCWVGRLKFFFQLDWWVGEVELADLGSTSPHHHSEGSLARLSYLLIFWFQMQVEDYYTLLAWILNESPRLCTLLPKQVGRLGSICSWQLIMAIPSCPTMCCRVASTSLHCRDAQLLDLSVPLVAATHLFCI